MLQATHRGIEVQPLEISVSFFFLNFAALIARGFSAGDCDGKLQRVECELCGTHSSKKRNLCEMKSQRLPDYKRW